MNAGAGPKTRRQHASPRRKFSIEYILEPPTQRWAKHVYDLKRLGGHPSLSRRETLETAKPVPRDGIKLYGGAYLITGGTVFKNRTKQHRHPEHVSMNKRKGATGLVAVLSLVTLVVMVVGVVAAPQSPGGGRTPRPIARNEVRNGGRSV